MDVRIDNKKMWESLYKAVDINIAAEISIALRDQGLTVNNNGEIVSIEPEPLKKNDYEETDFISTYSLGDGWV